MPSFDIFKKRSKRQDLDEHSQNLVKEYIEHSNQSTEFNILRDFPHNASFLCHLSTGYDNTYLLLLDYISLKHEIDTQLTSQSIWKEKTKAANDILDEFKHQLDNLLVKIERGSEKLEGICQECKKWHSEDEPNYTKMISKLNLFKMPM